MEESVDDMTAAEMAPSPTKVTATGVRWKYTKGSVRLTSSARMDGSPYDVWFQSVCVCVRVEEKTQGRCYDKWCNKGGGVGAGGWAGW